METLNEANNDVRMLEIRLKEKDQEMKLAELRVKELKKNVAHNRLRPIKPRTTRTNASIDAHSMDMYSEY